MAITSFGSLGAGRWGWTGTDAERLAMTIRADMAGGEFLTSDGAWWLCNGTAWVQTHASGAEHVTDAISLSGFSQVTVSLSTAAAQSAALTDGIYDVWCDVDCYIKVAATANDVTTSTGYLLRANNTIPVIVPDQEKIGGIVASGTGTLTYHRVK